VPNGIEKDKREEKKFLPADSRSENVLNIENRIMKNKKSKKRYQKQTKIEDKRKFVKKLSLWVNSLY